MAEPKIYACPTCAKEFDHPGKMLLHRVSAHDYRKGQDAEAAAAAKGGTAAGRQPRTPAPKPSSAPLPGEPEIVAAVQEFTGNARAFGGITRSLGAAHFGTTLMGVEVAKHTAGAVEEGGRWWIVRSRAVMAEPLLVEQAKRDPRIYRAIKAVNSLFTGGTALEVGGGLLAGAAVDVGLPPGIGFQLGPVPIQPIPMMIGDVLEYVAAERELGAQEAAAQSPNGQPAPETSGEPVAVAGGVQAT